MAKTDRMLLIEERAGKDIRTVIAEAYAETGTLPRAAEWITERYAPVSFGILSDWVAELGGRRVLEFSGEEVAG